MGIETLVNQEKWKSLCEVGVRVGVQVPVRTHVSMLGWSVAN